MPQLLEEIEHLKSQKAESDRSHQDEVMTLFQALSAAKTEIETRQLKIEELKSKNANSPDSQKLTNQAQNLQKLYETIKNKYMRLVQDHSKLLSQNQQAQLQIRTLNSTLTSKLDSKAILTTLSLRSQQIVSVSQTDKVILAQEKAEQLLVDRSIKTLENGLSGIYSVADENIPELCSMMINLAAQLNSVLVIAWSHCESLAQELTTASMEFYGNFSTENEIKTEKWAKDAGISQILEKIKNYGSKTDSNDNSIESEMEEALRIVEDSMKKMENMLNQAATDKSNGLDGISPEILDLCKELMGLIRLLILDATNLQNTVSLSGKLSGISPAEFYHKNSRWTDGLISAAKAVGWAAQFLTNSADKIMKQNGKLEVLQVACKETVSSTAQLVSASKVKAPQDKKGMDELGVLVNRSGQVNECAGRVLARVKTESLKENNNFSVEKFDTAMKIRKAEIESATKVTELENLLQAEREKLGVIRQGMYKNNGTTQESVETLQSKGEKIQVMLPIEKPAVAEKPKLIPE